MTVSLAEATAAARRIKARSYRFEPTFDVLADADLLSGFVLAGDTERLRTARCTHDVLLLAHCKECSLAGFCDCSECRESA